MTIKPFAIQGADLTLGGVNLQAGTTGVVIPGVTEATNYFAEEVNEQDGSNPDVFGGDEGAVTVIDNAEYLYLVNNGYTPSGSYVAATYSVDELDDGQIESINVNSSGVFLSADVANIDRGNMWATTTPTPFVSFNSANWTEIPYRPKMRAGAVENVGGGTGGGVVERSIQFPMGETGDTRGTIALTPDDATYICTADYENLTSQYQGNYSVVNSEAYDINQSGGVYNMITVDATGNTDLLFIISNGSYAGSDWTIDAGVAYGGVQTCDIVQTNGNLIYFSWPHRTGVDPTTIAQDDPATVTYNGTITQQPIWTKLINISQGGADNGGDGEISWRSEGDLTIETLRPAGYTGDCDLNLYAADDVFITANGDDVGITAFNVVNINTDDGSHTWTFNQNGNLTLPDGGDILDSNGVSVLSGLDANIWVQTFVSDTPTTDFPQIATSVEYDADDNVIALFSHLQTDGIGSDSRYFSVGKYSATGTKLWTAKFSDALNTDGWGLAVDNADSWIYVAGQTDNGIIYGVSTLTKIDSLDGSVVWSKIYDFGFASSSAVVDVDSTGNPVMVGYANNGTDSYLTVTKIDKTNGNVTWTRKLDGQTNEQAYGMAVGPAGEIVAVGSVDNLNYTEPYRTIVTLTATPASDPDWTTDILGATQGGLTYDVTFAGGVPTFSNIVDTDGNRYEGDLLVTFNASQLGSGSTNMEVRVGTTTGEDMSDRMVVVKYASDGTIAWQKAIQFDANYDCSGADADIDSNGNIYICGQFDIDGGGGPTNTGMALVKFDSTGVKQWTRRVTGDCETTATSIVVGPDDKLYISGVNGDAIVGTFTWVVAKYSLDGTVEWQRFIENTDSWTFAGQFFNGEFGGSNLAVRQGYVALAGGFGSLGFGQQAYAAVLQVSDTGNVFATGPWSLTAANLSGVLNGTASDIGVVDADLTDSDNVLTVSPDSVTLTTEVGNFLIGTLYTAPGGDNSLVNGAYSVVLGSTGTLTLPAGGTITEGYVTSNPTIQLTPASPDVASQKLVIKGGGAYTYTDNGISINYNNNTALVGDTLTFYINSNTYADQTLYWWIYPEGAGISDPGSGTVAVNEFGYGDFSFVLDSDDNEFTVRLSPENNNYDPANLGVESGLINPDAPTFDSEHHLHLTTGNLAETSIFLGTDDQNVRTTVNGGIQITTPNTTNNVWNFDVAGDLNLPDNGGIVFDRADTTIRVGMGFHIASGEGISLDAIDQTAILTLSGAGNGPVNQTYNKTNDTLYTGNDNSSVTVENLGGTWYVLIDGDSKYTSNDLIGWALSTGPGPVPVGVLSNGYKSWGFSPTGNLTLPNDAVIRTDGSNVEVGGVTNFNVEAAGVVNIYTNDGAHQWQFGNDGSTTLPGALVNSTVAKTGVLLPITTGAVSGLTHDSVLGGLTDGTYGPFTLTGVTLSVVVFGGVINGFTNVSGTATVNDVLGTIDSGDVGGTAGTTITITVTGVQQPTPTALDLTKSVNKLTTGYYTLADGVEGQIMHLVRQTGTNNATVIVANARVAGNQYTALEHYPFTTGDMNMLIFTDSAWQAMGGTWD